MRIATWNINGIRARADFLKHWLAAREPDIVGLQELKAGDEEFASAGLDEVGFSSAAFCQPGWNGVSILAREAVQPITCGLPGQEDQGARLIEAEVAGLRFINVYVPNGKTVSHPDFARKLDWLDGLYAYIADQHAPSDPIVMGGDFNLVPGPLDSWNEARLKGGIFHTDGERQRFHRLLEWGFRDVFRELRPTDQAFSWWDYRAGDFHQGRGLRIDFLLATAPVMKRVTGIEIDREYRKKKEGWTASDHAPVYADVDWPA